MQTRGPLQGVSVLVTRPAHQADSLCNVLAAEGASALRMPALEIVPCVNDALPTELATHLDRFHIAIFVSANAVRWGLPILRAGGKWPSDLAVAAVGEATATALREAGQSTAFAPEQDFSTDGLLALPRFAAVAGERILIVRGKGGREALAETLRQRGAEVVYAEVYERRRPSTRIGAQLTPAQRAAIDVVIATSNEALDNLAAMAEPDCTQWLRHRRLLVVSARAVHRAGELGFAAGVRCAANASDAAIVRALRDWQLSNPRLSTANPSA